MKKNLIQNLTLLLCIILLILTIIQTQRLEDLRSQMDLQLTNLENSLRSSISQVSSELRYELEEAAQPVENYDVTLSAIDHNSRSIVLDISVTLKQWSEDSAVSLILVDGNSRTATDMTTDGTGVYTAQLSVPLDSVQSFLLEAMVTTGGVSTAMELYGDSDITSLLPLRSSGCGWSTLEYHRGVLTLDYEYYLEWQYGQPGTIHNAAFDLYVNGVQTETLPAQAQGNSTFRLSSLNLECGENDSIRLVFRCEDSFGLGYAFPGLEITLEDGYIQDTITSDETEFYLVKPAENCDH